MYSLNDLEKEYLNLENITNKMAETNKKIGKINSTVSEIPPETLQKISAYSKLQLKQLEIVKKFHEMVDELKKYNYNKFHNSTINYYLGLCHYITKEYEQAYTCLNNIKFIVNDKVNETDNDIHRFDTTMFKYYKTAHYKIIHMLLDQQIFSEITESERRKLILHHALQAGDQLGGELSMFLAMYVTDDQGVISSTGDLFKEMPVLDAGNQDSSATQSLFLATIIKRQHQELEKLKQEANNSILIQFSRETTTISSIDNNQPTSPTIDTVNKSIPEQHRCSLVT